MIKFLQKFIKEPLVIFLLLGFVLYLYYDSITQDAAISDTKTEISVTPYEIQTLEKEYVKKYKKKMSKEALNLYVQNTYRKKVLLEESTRLDLHKNDSVIAKRLVEKMKFILLGSVEYKEPSEKELYKYYLQNIDEYSEVQTLSFKHIYFTSASNNMNELQTMLHFTKHSVDVKNLGDTFNGSNHYENISYEELEHKFGKYFANKLFKLRKGLWFTIHSKYGVHLVYVSKKTNTAPYKFDEVEDRVYKDYLKQKRDETVSQAYKNILKNYNLRLDK